MALRRVFTIDRVLRPVRPGPVPDFHPPPRAVADGVWTVERRLRFPPGLVLPTAMTVLRLADGGLVLVSPVAFDAPTRTQLAALGPVAAVVVPNSFHYLFAAAWAAAHPAARTFVAPGLAARIAGAPDGIEIGTEPPPGWPAELAHVLVGPGDVTEAVLLHRPSATLVLTDLAMNVVALEPAWQRWAWRATGILPRFGPSRSARLTLLRDRAAARAPLAAIAAWDFVRVVVAHGEPVTRDARAAFAAAFRAYLA